MKDIKEQLRRFKEYEYSIPVWKVAEEAANRIEELELEVSRITPALKTLALYDKIDQLQKALKQTNEIANAYLRYFNPAKLASDKENQWWSVYDQIDRNEYLLKKLNK